MDTVIFLRACEVSRRIRQAERNIELVDEGYGPATADKLLPQEMIDRHREEAKAYAKAALERIKAEFAAL